MWAFGFALQNTVVRDKTKPRQINRCNERKVM